MEKKFLSVISVQAQLTIMSQTFYTQYDTGHHAFTNKQNCTYNNLCSIYIKTHVQQKQVIFVYTSCPLKYSFSST